MQTNFSKSDLESSYKAWMLELLKAFDGKKPSIHAILNRASHWTLSAATMRHWFSDRASLPDVACFETLIDLMSQKVTTPPKQAIQVLTFKEVLYSLREARLHGSKLGIQALNDAEANQKLFDEGVLSIPCVKAKDLDEKVLQLGSRDFDGEVPPYCRRDLDSELALALKDPDRRLVVIVGPPKSGKTRTMIQALKESELASLPVYWLEPRQNSVARLLEVLPKRSDKRPVVVLDDLQNFRFEGENAINPGALDELMRRAMVVATLHESVVKQWNLLQLDHRAESKLQALDMPARAVQRKLIENQLVLLLALNVQEYANLNLVFPSALLDDKDFRLLASELAAAEALSRLLDSAQSSGNPHFENIFRAVLDAKIIHPDGATLEVLKVFAQAEHEQNSNAPWSESEWEKHIEFLTHGIAPGSPQAILLRTIGDRKKYSLFDALWADLRPPEWTSNALDHLDLGLELAIQASAAGYHEEAIRIAKDLDAEDTDVCFHLGRFHQMLDLVVEAEQYFRIAADAGGVHARYNLGLLLANTNRLEEAKKYYRLAADVGDPEAQNNLAILLDNSGQHIEAEKYFQLAAEQGSLLALNNLGLFLTAYDRLEEAEKYFLRAAEMGFLGARFNLGLMLANSGRLEEAEKHYRLAADQGDPHAQNNLGLLLDQAGLQGEAERYYRLAADAGHAQGQVNLGVFFQETGKNEEAEKYLALAADSGHAGARYQLALLLENLGRLVEAEINYRMAADAGDSGAQNNLGIILKNSDRLADAELYFRKSADQGNTLAQFNLGRLLALSNRFEEAERYWAMAAKQDEVAQNALGLLLERVGRSEEAESCYKLNEEAGDIGGTILRKLLGLEDSQPLETRLLVSTTLTSDERSYLNELCQFLEDFGLPSKAEIIRESLLELETIPSAD